MILLSPKPKMKNPFNYVLRKLFTYPSVVTIGGMWKTGKTDFALFISEKLFDLKLISECASNIDTKDHYKMISDLVSLRIWLHETNRRKLFIFDEANVHLTSRRAMSRENVGFIQLLGEISKAHARMIVIAQEIRTVDKEFMNPTWVRGTWIKRGLKKAELYSILTQRPFVVNNLPKTSITFDPYATAPFSELPKAENVFKEDDLKILWEWSHGKPSRELGFTYPIQFNRFCRKAVRQVLEKLQNKV